MAEVSSKERCFDFAMTGTFGKACEYGQKIYGEGFYGETEHQIDKNEYGVKEYGGAKYGSDDIRWGIYQRRHKEGKVIYVREKFYIPANPRTVPQEAWRDVFRQGMTAWGILTPEQKNEYTEKGKAKKLYGVNLFLRLWLKSQ